MHPYRRITFNQIVRTSRGYVNPLANDATSGGVAMAYILVVPSHTRRTAGRHHRDSTFILVSTCQPASKTFGREYLHCAGFL